MFRKTVLTSAIIGAGLVTTAGAAFAGDAPSGGHHDSGHHGHSKHHDGTDVDSSCSNGVGTGHKQGNGLIGIGNVLDAPITSNVCNILNDNVKNNLNGNHLSVSVGQSLGGLLGGTSAPQVQQAQPVQQAAPAQTFAAPSSVPQGTTTTPIG
ncbi:hypothetical protein [Actinomycetospora soli]|uniref:hypothetical protein n=1 Tax=Actinomycetospora soli TaxID=2893887 RepID=UPI001E341E24|nr:hypothetical protein [Actinomycetospora soli]MCD2189332.1 hypothetical protein [Actinomycetospora soli]